LPLHLLSLIGLAARGNLLANLTGYVKEVSNRPSGKHGEATVYTYSPVHIYICFPREVVGVCVHIFIALCVGGSKAAVGTVYQIQSLPHCTVLYIPLMFDRVPCCSNIHVSNTYNNQDATIWAHYSTDRYRM